MAEFERTVQSLEKDYDVLELRTLLSGPYDHGGAVVTIQSGAGATLSRRCLWVGSCAGLILG